MLYRAMKKAANGSPLEESSAKGLGVRKGPADWDIPIEGGFVRPGTGGMSVAIDDVKHLPQWRKPPPLGTGMDPVFEMSDGDVPVDLMLRLDPRKRGHGFLEPRRKMPIEEYEALLGQTRLAWRCIIEA